MQRMQKHPTSPMRVKEPKKRKELKKLNPGLHSGKSDIADLYTSWYNLEDRMNRELYQNFRPSMEQEPSKLFFMTFFMIIVMNSRALYFEEAAVLNAKTNNPKNPIDLTHPFNSNTMYISRLIDQIYVKYGKK